MFTRTLLGLGIKIWQVIQPKISPSKVQAVHADSSDSARTPHGIGGGE